MPFHDIVLEEDMDLLRKNVSQEIANAAPKEIRWFLLQVYIQSHSEITCRSDLFTLPQCIPMIVFNSNIYVP